MSDMVEVVIDSIRVSLMSQQRVVILREADAERYLAIWIGPYEAEAITIALQDVEVQRPLTHDLLRSVIEHLQAKVERVVITDLKENTFFALIHKVRNGQNLSVDARPSDAMALALRTDVPIFVEEGVLEKSSVSGEESGSDETERLRRWLEQVDPEELGKYEM